MSSIAIQKPYNINLANKIIDATEGFKLTWRVSGGVQGKFKITITEQGIIRHTYETLYSSLEYTIPANALSNPKNYSLKLEIWETNGQGGTQGAAQYIIAPFETSKRPVVSIDGSPGPIMTTTNEFSVSFNYTSDADLKSWNVRLYDNEELFIEESGFQQTSQQFHTFYNLRANRNYYVEVQAQSTKNLIGISSRVKLIVQPLAVPFSSTISHVPLQGGVGVRITWNPILVEGKTTGATSYINNNEIDVRNGSVYFDSGYSMNDNFYMKFLVRNLPNPTYPIVNNVEIYGKVADGGVPLGAFDKDWFWVDDPQYTTITGVTIYISPTSTGVPTSGWWLESDSVSIMQPVEITRDAEPPLASHNRIWLQEYFDRESSVFIRMFDDEDEVEIARYNGIFRLFINKEQVGQIQLDYTQYYIILKKTAGSWSLEGGGV